MAYSLGTGIPAGGSERVLPRALTTQDVWKALAVVLMVADHIGYYLLPVPVGAEIGDPHFWWRVVGRWCVPIWFFWAGYARSRDIPPLWWGGGVILVVANIVTGMFIFPLNNIFSLIFIRWIIDPVGRFALAHPVTLAMTVVGLVVLYPITSWVCEYGTLGLLLAVLGYSVRHRADGLGVLAWPALVPVLAGVCMVVTIGLQIVTFPGLGVAQMGAMAIGIMAVITGLILVPVQPWPAFTIWVPRSGVLALQFLGRQSLPLYVGHLVVLKAVCCALGVGLPLYGWFDWDWSQAASVAPPLE